MSNVLLIGHTGSLGSYLLDTLNPVITNLRFESSELAWDLSKFNNPKIDTVVIVARACGKTAPRRTTDTMGLEIRGLIKILSAYKGCNIIYTSSKAIYGIDNTDSRPVSKNKIKDYIVTAIDGGLINKTINIPEHQPEFIFDNMVGAEYNIYSNTKKCGEVLVRRFSNTYTILRIWDIQ
jgi:nucleoside-diphosphate-sugar epimerase